MNLPTELKTRIYDHIGTVQKHLVELPADEQREILQALEAHIHDALESRSEGQPTLEQLEAILAEMDPPESYGAAPLASATHPRPGKDQPAIAAIKAQGNPIKRLILVLVIVFVSFLIIMAGISIIFSFWAIAHPAMEQSVSISPVGSWVSVDFVEEPGQFSPDQKKFQGELQLKGITFLEDGKTAKPWWTWKEDMLIHHGEKSAAQFTIQVIDGTQYMFLEWLSGDVLEKGMPPQYYVLKRGEYADPGSDRS
jgi:uncharacterized membrane protein